MKVVSISDFHCGSRVGLTPPYWQYPKLNEYGMVQRECWEFYEDLARLHHRPDVLFVVGDTIDGKGHRSGGTELITSDRFEQAEMAIKCVELFDAKKIYFVYGTPYHTGMGEDHENTVAKHFGAPIRGEMFVRVEGTRFHLRHFVSSSSIPHGRYTSVAKEILNLLLQEQEENWPKVDVAIRSHVHYCVGAIDPARGSITNPALQARGSKFGIRKCGGKVHFGINVFDVDGTNWRNWHPVVKTIRSAIPKEFVV